MSSIAIITARGGSKRIPKKNIREFCGRPIIEYSIEAALKSKAFNEVMVSTDSEEIAEIARNCGASVPFMRSEKTSNDFATTRDVLLEVLENYKRVGKSFDYMTCIYPTAPFVTAEKLCETLRIIEDSKSSILVPVVKFSFPPQRAYIVNEGQLVWKWDEFKATRSQDLEPFYHDAGQFYVYNVGDYLAQNGSISTNMMPYILPETEVQDIDTFEDWKMAELKFNLMKEKTNELASDN